MIKFLLLVFILLVFTPFGNEDGTGVFGLGVTFDVFKLSLLLLVLYIKNFSFNIKLHKLIFILIFLIFIMLWVVFSPNNDYTDAKSLILNFIFSVLFLSIGLSRSDIIWALKCALIINVSAFFIQVFFFYAANYHIDFHQLIFPWSRATYYPSFGGILRATGFHMEPGAYVTNVMALILIYSIYKIQKKLIVICALTFVLTFSFSGLIYASLLGLLLTFNLTKKQAVLALSLFSLFIGYIVSIENPLTNYIEVRSNRIDSGVDMSVQYKSNNNEYVLSREGNQQAFGSGIGNNECQNCKYINSNGALFYTVFYMGLVGALGFIALYIFVFNIPFSYLGIISLIFVFIQRYDVTYPIIWMVGVFFLLRSRHDSQKVSLFNINK